MNAKCQGHSNNGENDCTCVVHEPFCRSVNWDVLSGVPYMLQVSVSLLFSHNMHTYFNIVSVKSQTHPRRLRAPCCCDVSLLPSSELVGYWLFLCFSNSLSIWSSSVYTLHWTLSLVWPLAPVAVDGAFSVRERQSRSQKKNKNEKQKQ